MSEQVNRLTVAEADFKWPDDEIVIRATDYDALHAEAEALQQRLTTEQGNAAYWKEQYQALRNDYQRTVSEKVGLRTELEAARGLLELCHAEMNEPADSGFEMSLRRRVGDFLTATPAPEALQFDKPSLLKDCNVTYSNSSRPLAEQRERQEVACWVPRACLDKLRNGCNNSPAVLTDGPAEFNDTPLYAVPQPAPDVQALVEAIATGHPRIDPNIPVPLDEEKHHCEHTLYLERERLHKLLTAHRQAQQGGNS